MKVEQLENKNQFVIFCDEKIVFQSYDSLIAIIENNRLTLGRDWNYSHTTLKHLYIFLERYMNHFYNNIKYSKNKKSEIQKLINQGYINYNSDLK